ncbi:CopD family protein [Sinorhizobium alkalisoli]|uniref:CopD family protein n=1 Tax=Sinorhizobium alkalisoli TaxID=1752398 RepID=UPI00124CD4F8|nr:CopD family protein [Sinorhizobium alkalisoli]
MMTTLKFFHIAAIALWAGGLISLPGLYAQRASVRDEESLYRLQMMVRFAYVAVISPAAFIAIATGTVLIFGQQTFAGWFSIKLFFVSALVVLHVLAGLVIIRLFRQGETYPQWQFVLTTAATSAVVLAIMFMVLAKPSIHAGGSLAMFEPGGLHRLARAVSPWTIP